MLKLYQYKYIKPPTAKAEADKRKRLSLAYEFYKTHKDICSQIEEINYNALMSGEKYNATLVTKQLKKLGYTDLGFTGKDLIKILDGTY